MVTNVSATKICSACGGVGMCVVSAPRPDYVERCPSCGSAFFHSGMENVSSENDVYNVDANYQRYLETSNESSLTQRYGETLTHLRSMLPTVDDPKLFDIGAGGGDFLAIARSRGFRIAGNEVSKPAIDECRSRHGIELDAELDLLNLARGQGAYDVVTMWCVLAHVDDPDELLRGARALLRPGGILFLSTPRYCAIDAFGLALRRLTAGRYRRVFDRRINHFHRRQYSHRGIRAYLKAEKFAPISIRPAIGYGLYMAEYLRSIGFPDFVARPVGWALDIFVRAGLLPRNILNVYARAL